MQLSAFLSHFVQRQYQFQNTLGKWVAWGTLSLVIITALVVVLRYGFNTGSIALQESVMYNHAILFMLGMSYTYAHDQHVRVDVLYSQLDTHKKALVNLVGTVLFALPVMAFVIWASWDYIGTSWQIKESSAEAGGIAYLYMLKTLIAIMAGLVILQSLAVLTQAYLTLFTDVQNNINNENTETEGKF